VTRALRTALAALLAGCAYNNEEILAELEARARAQPSPALEAAIHRDEAAPWAGRAEAAALPMLPAKVPAVLGRVNGVEMPLVLDTGTTSVILTAEAARHAGLYLPPAEPARLLGPGHVATARAGAFATLELGPNRLGPGLALVGVNRRPGDWMGLGTKVYAVVGCSVLSHFAVTFDFKKEEVRLKPTGRAGYTSFLCTTVQVNGRPYWLMVDSGATMVFLEPWAALELDLISPERAKRHEAKGGSLRDATFTRLTLDSVGVPGRIFRDVDGAVVNTFGERLSDEGVRAGGLLGLRGFGNLVWTLDYGTQRLHLHP
jgi:predicted aspartyl protease